jgi:hypothetical protein
LYGALGSPLQSWGWDINDEGVVVGSLQQTEAQFASGWMTSAFIYEPASNRVEIVDAPNQQGKSYISTSGAAINNDNRVVGACVDSSQVYWPFVYSAQVGGQFHVIDYPGTAAFDVNLAEQVLCGQPYGGGRAPCIWSAGSILQLPIQGYAYAMNDAGTVVGISDGTTGAYVYQQGKAYLLDDLLVANSVVPQPGRLHVVEACDINNDGCIAASGWNTSYIFQSYPLILTPDGQTPLPKYRPILPGALTLLRPGRMYSAARAEGATEGRDAGEQ